MQVYKWHKFPLTSVPIKFEDIKKELTWLGLDQTSIAANDQVTIFIQWISKGSNATRVCPFTWPKKGYAGFKTFDKEISDVDFSQPIDILAN